MANAAAGLFPRGAAKVLVELSLFAGGTKVVCVPMAPSSISGQTLRLRQLWLAAIAGRRVTAVSAVDRGRIRNAADLHGQRLLMSATPPSVPAELRI